MKDSLFEKSSIKKIKTNQKKLSQKENINFTVQQKNIVNPQGLEEHWFYALTEPRELLNFRISPRSTYYICNNTQIFQGSYFIEISRSQFSTIFRYRVPFRFSNFLTFPTGRVSNKSARVLIMIAIDHANSSNRILNCSSWAY